MKYLAILRKKQLRDECRLLDGAIDEADQEIRTLAREDEACERPARDVHDRLTTDRVWRSSRAPGRAARSAG